MKKHYGQSEIFNPKFKFKKSDLIKMKKLEILTAIAKQDSFPNLVEVINNFEKKIPITSMNLNYKTS